MSSPAKRQQQPPRGKDHNVTQVSAAWQGPLPPPDALHRFNEIIEGGAERIFRMAEMEQQHRIQTEQLAVHTNSEAAKAEIKAAQRGSWMGFAISGIAIIGALAAVPLGASWQVSVALVGIPIMGAVRALIIRK